MSCQQLTSLGLLQSLQLPSWTWLHDAKQERTLILTVVRDSAQDSVRSKRWCFTAGNQEKCSGTFSRHTVFGYGSRGTLGDPSLDTAPARSRRLLARCGGPKTPRPTRTPQTPPPRPRQNTPRTVHRKQANTWDPAGTSVPPRRERRAEPSTRVGGLREGGRDGTLTKSCATVLTISEENGS